MPEKEDKINKEREIYLDVGCGIGSSADFYTLNNGAQKVGVDIEEYLVREISKKESQGHFVVTDAHALPFTSNTYETVYCTHALEHMKHPKRVLSEMVRVTKPEGQLVLTVPHPRYESVVGKLINGYHGPFMHRHVFSPQGIKSLVEEAGFKVKKITTQKWWAAALITSKFLFNHFFPRMEVELGIGKLIPKNVKGGSDSSKTPTRISKVKRLAAIILNLIRPLNQLYPWETSIEAVKTKI